MSTYLVLVLVHRRRRLLGSVDLVVDIAPFFVVTSDILVYMHIMEKEDEDKEKEKEKERAC